jgi:acyl dehydratase
MISLFDVDVKVNFLGHFALCTRVPTRVGAIFSSMRGPFDTAGGTGRMRVFSGADDLLGSVGTDLGASSWRVIDQAMIDAFATTTGDDQWIHTDPVRAAGTPAGTTIAHGYLTLSLIPAMLRELYDVPSRRMGVNYGANRIRFTDMVPCGSAIRGRVSIAAAEEVPGGVQLTLAVTVERRGSERPACVAEVISRVVF